MRRFARPLFNFLIVLGLFIAVLPFGQKIYGQWSQRALASQWRDSEITQKKNINASQKPKATQSGKLAAHDPDSPALALSNSPSGAKRPWPLTKLTIAEIGLETFIVQGMDAPSLRRGPGHDANSSLPGEGNCVVAGHRNVYGGFFGRLDELLPGAPIELENRDGKWTYVVNAVFITPDTNLTILNAPAPGAPPVLTLLTCTLPHTNNRLVLQANLSAE